MTNRGMRAKGYHELDDHIAKQREFTHMIEKLCSRYHDNDLEIARDLIMVLGEWLLGYVLKDDGKYSELRSSSGNEPDIRL